MRDIRKRTFKLEDSIGHELGRSFRRLNRAVSTALRPFGISAVQGSILITLWARGSMTIGELQRAMSFSSSALTGAIDRMERADLVTRIPAPSDRRSFLVEPVKWPAARQRALFEALRAAEEALLAVFLGWERTQLLGLLRRLSAGEEGSG